MQAAIDVQNIGKHFKSNFLLRTISALQDVSFSIQEGEVFGLIGHNGAGKTTLIKILTGLIRPSTGQAALFGHPVGDIQALSQLGFLPERPYFYEYLTGREALNFYGRLAGLSANAIARRSSELLAMLKLEEAADRPMRLYSKGMLQRLGMAQAILHDPPLVLLDEPMSGLDPLGRGQIKDIIHLLKKQGKTILFSSHILSDVEELCDRVAVLANGHLRYEGDLETLTATYKEGVEIVIENVADEHMAGLSDLGAEITQQNGRVKLFLSNDQDDQRVIKQLIEQGFHIDRMIPKRMSLEEIVVRQFQSGKEEGR